MINAFIVEDEPKNLRILKNQIEKNCPELNIVGEADNIDTAQILINSLKPQIVFLDIELPYGNAFDMLENMEEVNFEIIFITAFSEYAIRAFKHSAIDYLLKPIDIDDLKIAVDKAIQNIERKSVNVRIKLLLEQLNSDPTVPVSYREREIIELLGQGLASKQIAAELGISKNTVDNHRQRLLKKFGVSSSAELVIKALSS